MFWQSYVDKVRQTKPDNLVRLFHLDERSGSSAKDYSPNARTGIYSGVTLQGGLQPCGLNASLYDGINGYTDIISNLETDFPIANRVRGTVLMWLKKDWSQADKQVSMHLISGGGQIEPFMDSAGGIFYLWSFIGGTERFVSCPVSGNGWHSFVMTWDTTLGGSSYVEGWKDGINQGIDTGAGGNWSGAFVKAVIGIDQNLAKWEWDGHMGVTGIWDTVLSDDEIRQISRV